MNGKTQNDLLAARQKFLSGETTKLEYVEEINQRHAGLFDYPAFIAGTDVGVVVEADDAGGAVHGEGKVAAAVAPDALALLCQPHAAAAPQRLLAVLAAAKADAVVKVVVEACTAAHCWRRCPKRSTAGCCCCGCC